MKTLFLKLFFSMEIRHLGFFISEQHSEHTHNEKKNTSFHVMKIKFAEYERQRNEENLQVRDFEYPVGEFFLDYPMDSSLFPTGSYLKLAGSLSKNESSG